MFRLFGAKKKDEAPVAPPQAPVKEEVAPVPVPSLNEQQKRVKMS